MAKALLAVALLLCISLPSLAAPPKKTPSWAELTTEQQQVLAPLAVDWDKLEPQRKRKWLGIAKRYPAMKPDAQANVQRRMQAWVKLTPAERQAARERYKKMEKLPPEKKRALAQKWDEYNRLPEQERRKLGGTPHQPPAATSSSAAPDPAPQSRVSSVPVGISVPAASAQ
jgi:Protein of unknown function (DUF3106)